LSRDKLLGGVCPGGALAGESLALLALLTVAALGGLALLVAGA
jgi:hypothetical protein